MELTVGYFEEVKTSRSQMRHGGMFCCVPGCTSSRMKAKSTGTSLPEKFTAPSVGFEV